MASKARPRQDSKLLHVNFRLSHHRQSNLGHPAKAINFAKEVAFFTKAVADMELIVEYSFSSAGSRDTTPCRQWRDIEAESIVWVNFGHGPMVKLGFIFETIDARYSDDRAKAEIEINPGSHRNGGVIDNTNLGKVRGS